MKKGLTIWVIVLVTIANTAIAQKMTVKDSDLHVLMEVNDEGTIGSITLPQGSAPGTTTNKLYNVDGALYWNGSQLGTASSGGGWTDSNGNVYLTTSGDKVGIGDSSPTNKLDVAGKIGIKDTQILYLPEQSTYTGTLILGDGGGSLSHDSGSEGRYNTAVGIGALNANSTGYGNTASGYKALWFNDTGNHNTASGYQALFHNDEGDDNTALGYFALYLSDTGEDNTASGSYALWQNTTGHHNTASGSNSMYDNSTGNYNTAIGASALSNNTEGDNNTALGYYALYSNISGHFNTALGNSALLSNTLGYYNTALGDQALSLNNTGQCNTGIGYFANGYNQTGSNNTMIGYAAGSGASVHSKSGNVFIGYQAGYNEAGDNKLYIANSNDPSPLIGGDFSEDEIYLNGKVAIGKTSPDSELDVNGEIRSTYGFFHDRGDATSLDKTVVDWTKDGTWYDWDLSGVVPEGTKGIVIWGYVKSSTAGEFFMLRENGNSNEYNILYCQTQVANIETCFRGVVSCDANRIIEYKFQNTGHWTDAVAAVVGWFK